MNWQRTEAFDEIQHYGKSQQTRKEHSPKTLQLRSRLVVTDGWFPSGLGKQRKCIPTNEWVKELWFNPFKEILLCDEKGQTAETCNSMKKSQHVILSEIFQTQNATYCMMPSVRILKKLKL